MLRLASWIAAALISASCAAGAVRSAPPGSLGASIQRSASPSPIVSPSLLVSPSAATPVGRIAFARAVGEATEAFINADGSNRLQLTHDGGSVNGLYWAPDGSRLYVEISHLKICGDTYCYPIHVVSVLPDGSGRVDLGQVAAYSSASISPDRRQAAYPSGEGFPKGNGQSFILPAQVIDLETATMSALSSTVGGGLEWSPDGTRLLMVSSRGIAVVEPSTGKTLLEADDTWVAPEGLFGWTPDGGSVIYHRCAPGLDKSAAVACIADAGWILNLSDATRTPRQYEGPALATGTLSPDRAWRARFEAGARIGLYLLPAGGGQSRLLADLGDNSAILDHPPTWSSDSSWIAFGSDGIYALPAASSGGQAIRIVEGYAPAWQP